MLRIGKEAISISCLILLGVDGAAASTAKPPERPRVLLDTTYVPPTGKTIRVAPGGNFQAALNTAQPGDLITLQAGATFAGSFRLPNKPGNGWITVRTSAPDGDLPPPGVRITPKHAAKLPKLIASGSPAISAGKGSHHYRFIGIEVTQADSGQTHNLVNLAKGSHHLIFDRCLIYGKPGMAMTRGIALNGASIAVIDSTIAGCKHPRNDAQAICGWDGPGPYKIVNNYLEASGENVMFGGGDPSTPNLIPSDIEIRHNHFSKPMTWKKDHPSYAGKFWVVKNLLEIKNAQRLLIDHNLFEHCWMNFDQNGAAVVLVPTNQSGGAPWSACQDVTFTHNIVRHASMAVRILYRGGNHETPKRILVQNNLFADIHRKYGPGGGRLVQRARGQDLVIGKNLRDRESAVFRALEAAVVSGRPAGGPARRRVASPSSRSRRKAPLARAILLKLKKSRTPSAAEQAVARRLQGELRQAIIAGVASGKRARVYIELAGRLTRAKLLSADERSIVASAQGLEVPLTWGQLSPKRFYGIARKYSNDHDALYAYCKGMGLTNEAQAESLQRQ